MTQKIDNPFAADDVGAVYAHGRPYHHPRSLARILAALDVDAVGRALDVACGTGMSTVALAEHAGTVVGLDVSPEMLRVAPSAANVSYLLGSAEQMPFPAAIFDAVTCCSGVHWFDQQRFFAELRRVLTRDGWVGLYDHYFMKMSGVPEFRDWTRELFDRYPLPPRNVQVGDPRAETPEGFALVASDFFEDPIPMTQQEFVDYQLTVSHCVAAVERGTPRADIRGWLLASTESLFAGVDARTIEFLGSITCLRALAQ